jgi:hypothetical protein
MKFAESPFFVPFIFLVLILVAVVWGFFRAREVKAFNASRRRAKKAAAKLLRVDRSEKSQSGEILANFALEIYPTGGEPYALHDLEWYIEPAAAAKFQEGATLNIRIDAQDRRVIYPAERWARNA